LALCRHIKGFSKLKNKPTLSPISPHILTLIFIHKPKALQRKGYKVGEFYCGGARKILPAWCFIEKIDTK
jgi:hypothetical protein